MADGDGTVNPGAGSGTDEGKVTFDEKQQSFINDLIDKRIGKVKSKAEEEKKALEDRVKELEDELKARPPKAKEGDGGKGGEDDPKEKQFKTLLEAEKAKAKQAELIAKQREDEAKASAAETLRIRKENAIAKAATKQNFYELDVVTKMTWDAIEWDDDVKSFVVKENGVVKQNSSLQPMTLEEYFADFAAKRPYLVNGDVVSGTGSSESTKSGGSPLIRTKADLKTAKDKAEFISKFGLEKFESLPLK